MINSGKELRFVLFGENKEQRTLREFRHMSQVLQDELPANIFSSISFLCYALSGRLKPELHLKLETMKTGNLSTLIIKLSKLEQRYDSILLPSLISILDK